MIMNEKKCNACEVSMRNPLNVFYKREIKSKERESKIEKKDIVPKGM